MKKCKFCLAEIEDEAVRCPACGKELEEAKQEAPAEEIPVQEASAEEMPAEKPKKKATPGKIAFAVAAIVVLLAVLVGLVLMGMQTKQNDSEEAVTIETVEETVEETTAPTSPPDGEKGTLVEKGSYTVSDEEILANKDVVVATIGDKVLTNGQLQIYYWMAYHDFMSSNYSYAPYFGLDTNQALETQIMDPTLHGEDMTMTWQHYFLKLALDSWQQFQAIALKAEEAGMKIGEEEQTMLDELETTLAENIQAYGVSMDEYFAKNFGPGAGLQEYKTYHELYYQGLPYYTAETEKMKPSAKEVEAYFTEHEEDYATGGITRDTRLVDVRHILLQPEAAEDGTVSEEAWAACEKQAQEILDAYLAGEPIEETAETAIEKTSEETFGEYAKKYSTDPGSQENGGLYTQVYQGEMVAPFDEWCFDETRKVGDTGLVRTDYGYHIMYFVNSHEEVWKAYATQDWLSEKAAQLLENATNEHPMEVSYDKINLGMLQ